MSDLAPGDDGLPVDEVGEWVEEKHRLLGEYLRLHGAVRKSRYPARRNAYIDLFCGPGRLKIRNTTRFVPGSPVVAWNNSVECGAPFSDIYISDTDVKRRGMCAERLRRLGAPVVEIAGNALEAATSVVAQVDPHGLHFAFIDPYNLSELRLELLGTLATVKRMDMMVHLSAMHLFRNFDKNVAGELQEFDAFAPGWRDKVRPSMTRDEQRRAAIAHWKILVDQMGMEASPEMKQVQNKQNRDLYWLLLIARHDLAQKFFRAALKASEQQRDLGF
jgi:three-Cys-motif partner protein